MKDYVKQSLKLVMTSFYIAMSVLLLITTITSFGTNKLLRIEPVDALIQQIEAESLLALLMVENQALTKPEKKLADRVIDYMKSIDETMLFGGAIPHISQHTGKILKAGEGSTYLTMSKDTTPDISTLMGERKANQDRVAELEQWKEAVTKEEEVSLPTSKTVHIVHTHNRESFYPELEAGAEAFHKDVNITLAGERLALQLKEHGINAMVETTDIGQMLQDRGLGYSKSYEMSREVVTQAIADEPTLTFFLDLHRDSQPKAITTATINGQSYAKLMFVIGENNPNYEKNEQFALRLHNEVETIMPGISRGIYAPPVKASGRNGVYNQDLSENAVLIEIGGVDNSLEEVYRAVDVFAKAFAKQLTLMEEEN
ncbi:stage II sporulation protein P [Paenalkalicoccus suaedae]|uniref:Stage II sporulation protein P n=1 Tax=Paenalkalicoccus suaedae TaxID=2592382 RepID=A0A859FF45_9BACI|nr:stage II sporulation protein P [Paenalkalicoccus suaedae]QKS70845.1 stage II sporulation protein P [Paenalkalicoccus suaedae]